MVRESAHAGSMQRGERRLNAPPLFFGSGNGISVYNRAFSNAVIAQEGEISGNTIDHNSQNGIGLVTRLRAGSGAVGAVGGSPGDQGPRDNRLVVVRLEVRLAGFGRADSKSWVGTS